MDVVEHVTKPGKRGVLFTFPGTEGKVLLDEVVIRDAMRLLADGKSNGFQVWRFEGWVIKNEEEKT